MLMVVNSFVLHNPRVRISKTRLKNLQLLWGRADQRGILQKDFAATVGTSANNFNQYLTGHRNVGDRMVVKVETRLKLPHGWMDTPHPEEWELSNHAYDGRARSPALSRTAAMLAARIESLTDEKAIEQIVSLIEFCEVRQAQTEGAPPGAHKPKPD